MSIEAAREILEAVRGHGADVIIAPDGELRIRPASVVPNGLIRQAKAHRDALRALLEERANGDLVLVESARCWRCQAERTPPSLDEQIDILRHEHEKRPRVFHFEEREWQRLRGMLQPGDLIAVAGNFHRIVDPTYSGVTVIRDGKVVTIARKELMDS